MKKVALLVELLLSPTHPSFSCNCITGNFWFLIISTSGALPAHRPVGPGLQISGLINPSLVINYALLE